MTGIVKGKGEIRTILKPDKKFSTVRITAEGITSRMVAMQTNLVRKLLADMAQLKTTEGSERRKAQSVVDAIDIGPIDAPTESVTAKTKAAESTRSPKRRKTDAEPRGRADDDDDLLTRYLQAYLEAERLRMKLVRIYPSM